MISSNAVNTDLSDIATALTGSLAADGQTAITGALKAVNGSSGAPGWTFNNDTSAGLFLSATGKLGIVAGGFGALINSVALKVSAATPSAAGSGYVVGDTITLTGGTGVLNAILQVATLSGSGVATATVLIGGNYSIAPGNPASQGATSGAGTGATFTLTTAATAQFSDLAGASLWQDFGATSYMAGAMGQPNALGLANYIGAANLAAAIVTSLPVPQPEGYLTPVSNQPIITGDSVAVSAVYWTPLVGLWAPIHNGSAIIPYQLAGQLQLSLTSSQAASGIYDIFLAYNSNSPVIGTGPNWTAGSGGSVTAGSCARGTGAGGTALARLQGFLTNAASMTLTWNTGSGNNSLTVAANQGIYLGSLFIDTTQGQVSNYISYRTGSPANKRGIWNAHNRQPLVMQGGDATATWTYAINTWRQSDGSANNTMVSFCGLSEEPISTNFKQNVSLATSVNGARIGIGINSTTVPSGFNGLPSNSQAGALPSILMANFTQAPSLGINNINMLEIASNGATNTFSGAIANMLMTTNWRG